MIFKVIRLHLASWSCWPSARRVKTCTSWFRRCRAAANSVTCGATPPTLMECRDSQENMAMRMASASCCPCFDETAENYHKRIPQKVLALKGVSKGVSTVNGKVVKDVV